MSDTEFDRLRPSRDFDRRRFVETAVGSDFAAAVRPVGAPLLGLDAGPDLGSAQTAVEPRRTALGNGG